MYFKIEFFITFASNQFFTNDWMFINHSLFFQGKYFLKLSFTILKVKFSMTVIIKTNFLKETFFYKIEKKYYLSFIYIKKNAIKYPRSNLYKYTCTW